MPNDEFHPSKVSLVEFDGIELYLVHPACIFSPSNDVDESLQVDDAVAPARPGPVSYPLDGSPSNDDRILDDIDGYVPDAGLAFTVADIGEAEVVTRGERSMVPVPEALLVAWEDGRGDDEYVEVE